MSSLESLDVVEAFVLSIDDECDCVLCALYAASRKTSDLFIQLKDSLVSHVRDLGTVITKVQHAWLAGDFHSFDALVGDTACHSRALLLYLLSTCGEVSRCTRAESFLIACYILSQCKVEHKDGDGRVISETMSDELIVRLGRVTKAKTKALRNGLQRTVAGISSALVVAACISVPSEPRPSNGWRDDLLSDSDLLCSLGRRDIVGREIMPDFVTFTGLFLQAAARCAPIVVKGEHTCKKHCPARRQFCFKYLPDAEGRYHIQSEQRDCPPTPCIAMLCYSNHAAEEEDHHSLNPNVDPREEVTRAAQEKVSPRSGSEGGCEHFSAFLGFLSPFSLQDLVLADSAAHPQFPKSVDHGSGDAVVAAFPEPMRQLFYQMRELSGKRAIGKSAGSSSSSFWIDHVYCSTLQKEMD